MTNYTTRPAQFRFPRWAHEFLAEEAAVSGRSKTEVLVEALDLYRHRKLESQLVAGYTEWSDTLREETAEWNGALGDGLEPEKW